MTDQPPAFLSGVLDRRHILTGADAEPYCTDWRGLFHGTALAVLRPGTAAQVASCVAACAKAGIAVVPQGGNTGLCGGATPQDGQVVLSLSRLNAVRDLDPVDFTITLEAGVTLQAARMAADQAGLMLPLSLASGGSAQIGGLVATNAGGNATLRFGNMRELVLGLEVVLPDGRIWNGLRRLRKDNTGIALRQLFIGSEGTLGIVTACCLRLVPAPTQREVTLVAVPSARAALDLLGLMRRADEAALHAFEYISGAALRMVLAQMECTDPFEKDWPDYVLIELAGNRPGLRTTLNNALAAAIERDLACDAVVASSEAQRNALWRLRENQADAQARAGATVKNDISVPVSSVPALIENATHICEALVPGVQVVPFGHLGDGNIHFNLVAPAGSDPAAFLALGEALMQAVGEVARALDGSFSAEHGVGQLKRGLLQEWRGGVEMELMRRVKSALDPTGLLNPGKVL
jgi:FAD/FMN-containing dehydrogenase